MEKSISEQISELFSEVSKYVNLKLEYFQISMGERLVKFLGFFMHRALVIYLFFFVLFFLGMAFSIWFGEATGRTYLGYLITGGVFILLGALVFFLRKPLLDDPMTRAFFKMTGMDDPNKEDDEK